MMTYKFGNKIYSGTTAQDVVNQIRLGAYTTYDSNKEYMQAVQKRVLIYNNNLIRITDEATFLSELVRVNALVVV